MGKASSDPSSSFISFAVFLHASIFLLEIITWAPWDAAWNAIDLPIPFDEPVIKNDLFFKLNYDI